jgi:hypothetical protein
MTFASTVIPRAGRHIEVRTSVLAVGSLAEVAGDGPRGTEMKAQLRVLRSGRVSGRVRRPGGPARGPAGCLAGFLVALTALAVDAVTYLGLFRRWLARWGPPTTKPGGRCRVATWCRPVPGAPPAPSPSACCRPGVAVAAQLVTGEPAGTATTCSRSGASAAPSYQAGMAASSRRSHPHDARHRLRRRGCRRRPLLRRPHHRRDRVMVPDVEPLDQHSCR